MRTTVARTLTVALGIVLLSGCASMLGGRAEAPLATAAAIQNIPAPAADLARERFETLGPHFENFGVMNADIYRGAQPDTSKIGLLAEAGLRTVIDFRDKPDLAAAERAACQAAGLRYINLPWSGHDPVPGEHVDRFLELIGDPQNLPVYVHCKRGAERTGTMLAIYRMEVDGWEPARAYAEMEQYRFRSFWFRHLKRFVLDYEASP